MVFLKKLFRMFLVLLTLNLVLAESLTFAGQITPKDKVTFFEPQHRTGTISDLEEISEKQGWFSRYKWWILGGVVLLAGAAGGLSSGGGGASDTDPGPSSGSATVTW